MTSDDLLKELRRLNIIDEAAAARVRREALMADKPVEELLYSERLADDTKVAEAKSAILKIPYQRVDLAKYDQALLELIPEETARTYQSVALGKRDNLLIIGMVNPDNIKAQEALKFIARRARLNLGVYLVSFGDWQQIMQKYSPYRSEIERAVKSLNLKTGANQPLKMVSLDVAENSESAPIIRIVADSLKEAIQAKASDIHIEPQENYLRIRFRVNGELKEVAALPPELTQPVTSRVKVMCDMKIDENRVPQDGRFRTKIFDKEVDFRVSTFPTPLGEKVAIRVLDPSSGIKTFDDLGLMGKNLDRVNAAIDKPFGLILVTGPTGSGKSTSLYALLKKLNKEEINIVSLEDPVEYFMSGINQSQVRPEIGYDFASGLRQILRQDPDVIMVGEIRDNETASLAVQAALTGHIVLSTLHTNNAAGVVSRLIDMKVPSFLLPVSLNLMLAQRLIGKLCDKCRVAEEAPEAMQKVIKKAITELPRDTKIEYTEPYKTYHAPGCSACNGRGIIGRIAIFEAIEMTPVLKELVTTDPSIQHILKAAKGEGMITLRGDGVLKALAGLISMEEVLRETEDE